jgi:LysR family glycine cleavage system transcriptional activator
LLWVRVFEAAARHESFVAAAKELSVTPGAVSRVVKELEGFMGVTLFVRGARSVQLTSIARIYARAITPAIHQIALACAQVHAARLSSIETEPVDRNQSCEHVSG